MQSIKNIYKIGPGPSSSHTFGPMKASSYMLEKYPEADRFDVILYGSLALTGKGHLTDMIIKKTLNPKKTNIEFNLKDTCKHPNTMTIEAFKENQSLGKHQLVEEKSKLMGKKMMKLMMYILIPRWMISRTIVNKDIFV